MTSHPQTVRTRRTVHKKWDCVQVGSVARALALTVFVAIAAPAVAAVVFVSRTLAGIATRRGPVSAIGEAASPIVCAAHECGAEAPRNTWTNGEISA